MINWHADVLSPETRTDTGYKNTQNVRRFFILHLGSDFYFTRPFMQWIKTHEGISLAEVMEEWKRRRREAER